MKCPACPDTTLVMSDRQGVEIDYCPQCRGIWLDRGELDKLLERSAAHEAGRAPVAAAAAPQAYPPAAPQGYPPAAPPGYPPGYGARRPDFEDSDFRHGKHGHGQYRKKSWLSDIFD